MPVNVDASERPRLSVVEHFSDILSAITSLSVWIPSIVPQAPPPPGVSPRNRGSEVRKTVGLFRGLRRIQQICRHFLLGSPFSALFRNSPLLGSEFACRRLLLFTVPFVSGESVPSRSRAALWCGDFASALLHSKRVFTSFEARIGPGNSDQVS